MNKLKIVALSLLATAFVACSHKEKRQNVDTVQNEQNFGLSSIMLEDSITEAEAQSPESWLKVGKNGKTVNLTAERNTGSKSRNAKVIIKTSKDIFTVSVKQDGNVSNAEKAEENASKSEQDVQNITLILVILMLLIQIVYIVLRLRRGNKSKKSIVEKTPEGHTMYQSELPEYKDNHISEQIKNLALTLNSYIGEQNKLNASGEQITKMFSKICEIERILKKVSKAPEPMCKYPPLPPEDKQDRKCKTKYYVKLPKGEVFTDATVNNLIGAKFCIETTDGQIGTFTPLDLKELRFAENTRFALRPTPSSCELNEANSMSIKTEGSVRFEESKNWWRIEKPCEVELTK